MKLAKRIAFVCLVLTVIIVKKEPVFANINCGGGSCSPPYGVTVWEHCYYTGENHTCTELENHCYNYCGDDGVEAFDCLGSPPSNDGLCTCGNPYNCPACTRDPNDCDPQTPLNMTTCECQGSPLIVDTDGGGIELTDVAAGVEFNFTGRAVRRMAWTRGQIRSGFLVLDRNSDGVVNDGTELFGSVTEQPVSESPNGFTALALFDQRANGGNGDSWIDKNDAVFSRLRVWLDSDHDGVSAPAELRTLRDVGIKRISLRYEATDFADEHGNYFKLRARVVDSIDRTRWVWDVWLNVAPLTH